jgi:hypothetical protein
MHFYWLLIASLATWRLTHLLSLEDGPWDLLLRVRTRLGRSALGTLMDCFYCLSLWVSLPIAIALAESWKERFILWPALSAVAVLLQRVTARHGADLGSDHLNPIYLEDPEKDDHVLRTR